MTMIKYAVATVLVGGLLIACTAPGLDGTPYGSGDDDIDTSKSSSQGGGACLSDLASIDLTKLTACDGPKGGAKGKCLPSAKLGEFGDKFDQASCKSGESCVPNKLVTGVENALKKNQKLEFKKCKPILGKSEEDGRCFSALAKDVVKNYDLLKNATGSQCDADEVCAPCLNPLANNAPTGVCMDTSNLSKCEKGGANGGGGGGGPAATCPYVGPPLVDVNTFPTEDCGSGMRCVDKTLLPSAELASNLKPCSKGVCAPEKSVAAAGNYVPKTCVSISNAEGRCINENIPSVAAQKNMLPRTGCDAGEVCAPCYNPADGKPTGACATAKCDAPKQPAVTFKACCVDKNTPAGRGKCVPKSSVPSNLQKNLGDDDGTCTKDVDVCVPAEFVTQPGYKGSPCQGSSFITGSYTGVCLSDCLEFGFFQSLGISKGSCSSGNKCVPCTNPLDGKPTGAPGCPGT
jgi:hypothetical protein